MNIDRIQVVDRHRADLGDLTELTESIRAYGLMHPVVVTDDLRLIAGHRRLEACRALGWTDVKVTFASNVSDAAALLQMERDENVCRKDMTPSEKVALGKALTELEAPKARDNLAAAGRASAPGKPSYDGTNLSHPKQDTREIVAPAVGLSTASYSRAKQLIAAAEQGDPVAAEKVAEMDATGKITKPHTEWKASLEPAKTVEAIRVRWETVADLAAQGYSSRQIASKIELSDETVRREARRRGIDIHADKVVGRSRRLDHADIVRRVVEGLETTTGSTLNLIDWGVVKADYDPATAGEWLSSLDQSLSRLRGFRNQIKELSQS